MSDTDKSFSQHLPLPGHLRANLVAMINHNLSQDRNVTQKISFDQLFIDFRIYLFVVNEYFAKPDLGRADGAILIYLTQLAMTYSNPNRLEDLARVIAPNEKFHEAFIDLVKSGEDVIAYKQRSDSNPKGPLRPNRDCSTYMRKILGMKPE